MDRNPHSHSQCDNPTRGISNIMKINELVDATEVSASPAGVDAEAKEITELFSATISDLQSAHEKLNSLMKVLQNKHTHIESAPVAKCIGTTAKSVDEMNALAAQWREAAQSQRDELRRERPPGALGTGIKNLTAGKRHSGLSLHEALVILLSPSDVFETSAYVNGQLYFERAKTPEELGRDTVFEFDRLLDALGVDE